MLEERGDLFSFPLRTKHTLRCVTTNGILNSKGELVMGAGIALYAKNLFPTLPKLLGQEVRAQGNHVYVFPQISIASFPTKNHWRDKSSLSLIEQSCQELVDIAETWDTVLLPRPGTLNGGLDWSEVKPILEKYFTSEKFIVVVKP